MQHARIDRGLMGYVQVNVERHTQESLTAFMGEAAILEEIMECYHMTGAIDFLFKVAIKDMDEYSRGLVTKLGNLPGVRQFTSFFCHVGDQMRNGLFAEITRKHYHNLI